jgi:hypothetical protein
MFAPLTPVPARSCGLAVSLATEHHKICADDADRRGSKAFEVARLEITSVEHQRCYGAIRYLMFH